MITNKKLKYIALGFVFWFIVDWATVKGFHLSYFSVPLIGYILRVINFSLYPAIFSYVIFNREWSEKKLLALTIAAAFIIEVVWLKNAILYTFPDFIIFIPVGICIYSILTFFPLWIVNQKVRKNKKKIILLFMVLVALTILSFKTQS